jgi:glycosyltransferase involved in cell wall biosynthesis
MTVKRKTVLWCGDAVVSSGFARATHKIINGLLPDWDVVVLGLNYHGDPHDYPYRIYPCKNPLTGATNAFGLQRLAELIQKHGPDVVVVQNDPWNIPYYLKACGNVPVVGFVAVDGKNCRGAGMNGLANAVFWTRFGEEQAKLWTEERLNQTYNCFDALLSTSQAEGWNLPAMEAMAAGVPCVLPAWAAHTEWPEGAAELVPCTATCCTPNNINVICGIADPEGTVAALDRLYRDPAHRRDLSVRGQALVAQPRYRWPAVAEAFKAALEGSLDGGTNRRPVQPLLEEANA